MTTVVTSEVTSLAALLASLEAPVNTALYTEVTPPTTWVVRDV